MVSGMKKIGIRERTRWCEVPSRWASWRREPKWDEIWMMTLALGRSIELSPTFEMKIVLLDGLNWNWDRICIRSLLLVGP